MKKVMMTLFMTGFLALGSMQFLTAASATTGDCGLGCLSQFNHCLSTTTNEGYCNRQLDICFEACGLNGPGVPDTGGTGGTGGGTGGAGSGGDSPTHHDQY